MSLRSRVRHVFPMAVLVTATWAGGSALGLIAALFRLLTDALPTLRLGVLMGIGALASVAVLSDELRGLLPHRACQVPTQTIRNLGPVRAGLYWGFELGLGVRTYPVTPAIYLVVAGCMTSVSPSAGVAVGGLYGVARGVAIASAGWLSQRRSEREEGWIVARGLVARTRFFVFAASATCVAVLAMSAW